MALAAAGVLLRADRQAAESVLAGQVLAVAAAGFVAANRAAVLLSHGNNWLNMENPGS
jgi:hypothetical protein